MLEYYRQLADIATGRVELPRVRLKAPPGISHVYTLSGQQFLVQDGYVSVPGSTTQRKTVPAGNHPA
jgi:hypothetical protein